MRVERFDALDGVFAATKTGLYRSLDGETWTNLEVPREKVYAVGASPDGNRLYAGTRPAHVYVTTSVPGSGSEGADYEWRELDGFQRLPSRGEWGTTRHENLAQVRNLCTHRDALGRLVAGVEAGGVHRSDDGGESWEERREGVHDDIHELHAIGGDEYVAATGVGLYRTDDAGSTWTRLDRDTEQSYFRATLADDGVLYASGACGPSPTWEDDDANPTLFECRDGLTLETVETPCPDEMVAGLSTVDGVPVGATHRGNVLMKRADGWTVVGTVPVRGDLTGRYVPLCWFDR